MDLEHRKDLGDRHAVLAALAVALLAGIVSSHAPELRGNTDNGRAAPSTSLIE
jgi:hypothetical protein